MDNTRGGCYLLHFDRPLAHALHYLGWAQDDIDARIETHRRGQGARLLAVLKREGIGWQLARTWPGASRSFERRLKRLHKISPYCPICTPLHYRKGPD